MKSRTSKIKRTTKETDVTVNVNLDGQGKISVSTGISFLDHLITAFGKHAMLDLQVKSKSIGFHPSVKDPEFLMDRLPPEVFSEFSEIINNQKDYPKELLDAIEFYAPDLGVSHAVGIIPISSYPLQAFMKILLRFFILH